MIASVVIELLAGPVGASGIRQRSAGIPRPVRAVRRRLARWSRYLQITGIVARYGLSPYLAGRHKPAAVEPHGTHNARRLWRRVRDALEEAGGAFIKLGQVLSTRSDLLPLDAIVELAGLQDKVPPAPHEAVETLLAAELGAPPAKVFAAFDPEPLAAASIAQVHRARLASGEQVVVKVQRPGIREPIARDLDILLNMARTIAARAAWARAFGVVDLAEGFAEALKEELDFRVEARNIAAVASALDAMDGVGSRETVRIPRVFPQLSTGRILIIEWLDGVSVRDAGPLLEQLGLSRLTLARTLLRCFLRQILRGGIFHADPHPGNILLLRDGSLALIDFGSVGRLDPLEQAALQRMFIALDRRDAALLSDALLDIAEGRAGIDGDRLEHALAHFMAQRLGPGMPVGPELFRDLFALLFDFGLAFPPVVAGMFRALVTLQGTLEVLAPGFQLVDEVRAMGAEWVRASMAPASLQKAATDELLALLPILRRLPRRMDQIMEEAAHGALLVNVRLFADDRDVRIVTRLVSWTILAFLGAALGLISILLLGLKGGPALTATVSVYQVIGYFGLFISVVLILRVIFAIARERAA
jgi:ubiquinone biosynthesis protein